MLYAIVHARDVNAKLYAPSIAKGIRHRSIIAKSLAHVTRLSKIDGRIPAFKRGCYSEQDYFLHKYCISFTQA